MPRKVNYTDKFEKFSRQTYFDKLDPDEKACVEEMAFRHLLTFQEFRQVVEAARDLTMWGEGGIANWWQRHRDNAEVGQPSQNDVRKKQLLSNLQSHIVHLRSQPKMYPKQPFSRPKKREKSKIVAAQSDKNIFGMCPVASERTVCCNLRTIDAVENCIFGCSYCTIQTFYSDKIVFDEKFAQKLAQIELEKDRFYHIGTGQSSDSLAWGNRNGILDSLCQFAADHPNILLEFKTKSNNVRYFLDNPTPPNIVCSWSMNTPTIIDNEEHFTANLDERIEAARHVAACGVKVAFHFHPMVYYDSWETDYPKVAETLIRQFEPQQVLFVSFGSVTLIKPVLTKIRNLGFQTKMTQMELVPDPHGKLTYPDDVKIAMFSKIHESFSPWRNEVFFYLCMEKAAIWERAFGYVYPDNETFERDFGQKTLHQKVRRPALENATPA